MSNQPETPAGTLPQSVPHVYSADFTDAYATGAVVSGPLPDGTFQILFVQDVLHFDDVKLVFDKTDYKVGDNVSARLDYPGSSGQARREVMVRLRLTPAVMQEAATVMLAQLAQTGTLAQGEGLQVKIGTRPTPAAPSGG